MDSNRYWDISQILSQHEVTTIRDWEYLIEKSKFVEIQNKVIHCCAEWFNFGERDLFNMHVDLSLAEVVEKAEHGVLEEWDIDTIVLVIGNILSSKLRKSDIDWFNLMKNEK